MHRCYQGCTTNRIHASGVIRGTQLTWYTAATSSGWTTCLIFPNDWGKPRKIWTGRLIMSDCRFFITLPEAGMPNSAQRSLVTEFRSTVLTTKFGRKLRTVLTYIGPSMSTFDLNSCAILQHNHVPSCNTVMWHLATRSCDILQHSHSELHGRVTEAATKAHVKAQSYNFYAGTEEDHVNINLVTKGTKSPVQ